MAGFLIVQGGPGTLDTVPEVAAAKDIPMAFQLVKSLSDGSVVFVQQETQQFGTFPFPGFRTIHRDAPTAHLRRSFRHPHNRVFGAHTAWMGRASAGTGWHNSGSAKPIFLYDKWRRQSCPGECSPVRCSGGGCSTAPTVTTFSWFWRRERNTEEAKQGLAFTDRRAGRDYVAENLPPPSPGDPPLDTFWDRA